MVLESCQVGSISTITTEPGKWRARHWHKNDGHWIEILEGQVVIYEARHYDSSPKDVTRKVLNKGDIHWTGPEIEHEMTFPCFTVFKCYSTLPRNQDNYEADTVRFDYSLEEIYENQSKKE